VTAAACPATATTTHDGRLTPPLPAPTPRPPSTAGRDRLRRDGCPRPSTPPRRNRSRPPVAGAGPTRLRAAARPGPTRLRAAARPGRTRLRAGAARSGRTRLRAGAGRSGPTRLRAAARPGPTRL